MKYFFTIITVLFIKSVSFAQVIGCHTIIQNEIYSELKKMYLECQKTNLENDIKIFNEKTETWNVCKLNNEFRIIQIESKTNTSIYQETYFEYNGKLRYAKKTEKTNQQKGFEELKYSSESFFEDGILIFATCFVPEKKKDESNCGVESIIRNYYQRSSELD